MNKIEDKILSIIDEAHKEEDVVFIVRLPKGSTLKPVISEYCRDNYTILVSPKDFDLIDVGKIKYKD